MQLLVIGCSTMFFADSIARLLAIPVTAYFAALADCCGTNSASDVRTTGCRSSGSTVVFNFARSEAHTLADDVALHQASAEGIVSCVDRRTPNTSVHLTYPMVTFRL